MQYDYVFMINIFGSRSLNMIYCRQILQYMMCYLGFRPKCQKWTVSPLTVHVKTVRPWLGHKTSIFEKKNILFLIFINNVWDYSTINPKQSCFGTQMLTTFCVVLLCLYMQWYIIKRFICLLKVSVSKRNNINNSY